MYESWAKYEAVCRYFPFDPAADEQSYRDRVLHWVESYDSGLYFQWVIEQKADHALIGIINLGRVDEASLIMATLPFALTGGIWFLYLLNYNLSIATGVGFIALAGVAAEFGVVMLIYLKHALEERCPDGRRPTLPELLDAIREGAVLRVRPKAMTVAVILAGLVPIVWSSGTGSEVMSRIAAPMLGGMVTAPLLSLFVIPAVYVLMRKPR